MVSEHIHVASGGGHRGPPTLYAHMEDEDEHWQREDEVTQQEDSIGSKAIPVHQTGQNLRVDRGVGHVGPRLDAADRLGRQRDDVNNDESFTMNCCYFFCKDAPRGNNSMIILNYKSKNNICKYASTLINTPTSSPSGPDILTDVHSSPQQKKSKDVLFFPEHFLTVTFIYV